MPATLLRASSATVLCHPIPGATPNSAIPGLEKATRNQLVEALNASTSILRRTGLVCRNRRALQAEWEARLEYARLQALAKDVACHNDDVECREEVIEALMAEGKARAVAAALTSTTAKMLAEGRRLGVL